MTLITTTMTTESLPMPMAKRDGIEIVYKSDVDRPTVGYTVEPHPPTPRDAK